MKTIKFSHGLRARLGVILGFVSEPFIHALIRAGKRGRAGTYYPTDLNRVNLLLAVTHDVTGRIFEAAVVGGNVAAAVAALAAAVADEDHALEFAPEYAAARW